MIGNTCAAKYSLMDNYTCKIIFFIDDIYAICMYIKHVDDTIVIT